MMEPLHVHDRIRREIERNEKLAKQRANESDVYARVAASLQDVLDRSIRDAKASAAVDAARVVFDPETGIGEVKP